MIEILATALEDGWAYVKRDEDILLLRPPYEEWNVSPSSKATVEKAVSVHGFERLHRSFDDWDSLIGFLEESLMDVRRAQGQKMPSSDSITEIVKFAPKEVVYTYFNRVESELIPNREYQAAVDLLTKILESDNVRNDVQMYERARDLLHRCRKLVSDQALNRKVLADQQTNL